MSLRGDFRAHEHGQVMLPFLVLRCLECALAPTKVAVVKKSESLAGRVDNVEPALATGAVRPTRETTVIQRVPLLLGIRVWDRSTPIALPLKQGLTVLYGRNGAGRSTPIDALESAVWGIAGRLPVELHFNFEGTPTAGRLRPGVARADS